MAMLDYNGLLYFWQKIKGFLNNKVDKVEVKQLSTNDYTTAEKNKLAGLSNYSHPTSAGNKHIPAGGAAGKISAAGHISKSIVETLPAVKDAKDNVIYMIKKATPDGSNLYDEYMLISGALEKIGDTKTVLESITNGQIDTIVAS